MVPWAPACSFAPRAHYRKELHPGSYFLPHLGALLGRWLCESHWCVHQLATGREPLTWLAQCGGSNKHRDVVTL